MEEKVFIKKLGEYEIDITPLIEKNKVFTDILPQKESHLLNLSNHLLIKIILLSNKSMVEYRMRWNIMRTCKKLYNICGNVIIKGEMKYEIYKMENPSIYSILKDKISMEEVKKTTMEIENKVNVLENIKKMIHYVNESDSIKCDYDKFFTMPCIKLLLHEKDEVFDIYKVVLMELMLEKSNPDYKILITSSILRGLMSNKDYEVKSSLTLLSNLKIPQAYEYFPSYLYIIFTDK
eukprot:TRINITY_DN10720_c0_g1_i1.p1 TRINITY_DN10720_c0_g1~~TRINITY_DN10720_c0_g1_i1.p1  ORF type:complete len:235 (+),score=33.84 TRINITY_DN10720_c0_g1_i1:2-706(+)